MFQSIKASCTRCNVLSRRALSNLPDRPPIPRRAMLYVPGSNPRMLEKSLSSPADSIAYDLEDSVSSNKKAEARSKISAFLDGERRPKGEVMVRVNAVRSGYEESDLDSVLRTRHVSAIALPKTDSPDHVDYLVSRIRKLSPPQKQRGRDAIRIVAMIESARAMVRIKEIASSGGGHLDALLFAAEDWLTRSTGRMELLYPRSKVVTTAKAFGLQAIDLVCVNYKDESALREESEEGRRLGFDGKQAIHPAQVDIIHTAFSPVQTDIDRASRIKIAFETHGAAGKGAFELDGQMIDAPVYKQVGEDQVLQLTCTGDEGACEGSGCGDAGTGKCIIMTSKLLH